MVSYLGRDNHLLGLKKTDMQCVGRTKNGMRCKNEASLLVCGHHTWQPIAFLLSAVTIIGVFGGVYQDVVKPISEEIASDELTTPKNNQAAIEQITIPVEIESTWDEYSELDRKAEFYVVRSESPGMQTVIFSGAAKVEIPKDGMTVNEMISISPHKTTKTNVILPKSEQLQKYLDEGGYEIQLVLFNQYGRMFPHMEQKLFDKEIIARGFRYLFRLVLSK
ncbi:MAG: hypothetical protein ABW168_03290 [Sedimenticola sp.]